jgi:hypothetical protein
VTDAEIAWLLARARVLTDEERHAAARECRRHQVKVDEWRSCASIHPDAAREVYDRLQALAAKVKREGRQ